MIANNCNMVTSVSYQSVPMTASVTCRDRKSKIVMKYNFSVGIRMLMYVLLYYLYFSKKKLYNHFCTIDAYIQPPWLSVSNIW